MSFGTGPDIEDSDLGCFVDDSTYMTDCIVDGAMGAGPAPELMGLLMAGTLLSSLYIAGDGTIAVPAVVTIIVGASMVPLLPPQYVRFAYTVAIMGIVVAAFSVWTRFTHQAGY